MTDGLPVWAQIAMGGLVGGFAVGMAWQRQQFRTQIANQTATKAMTELGERAERFETRLTLVERTLAEILATLVGGLAGGGGFVAEQKYQGRFLHWIRNCLQGIAGQLGILEDLQPPPSRHE